MKTPPSDPQQTEDLQIEQLPGGLPSALEAILMVVDEPLAVEELAYRIQVPAHQVEEALCALESQYCQDQRGFTLRRIDGAWRFYSRAPYADVVTQVITDERRARLSPAALETLAVVAYRQPVSRSRISSVRGVNVDGVVRTLCARGLIAQVGIDNSTNAALYGTTTLFLERLGISALEELPDLAPFLPDQDALTDEEGTL